MVSLQAGALAAGRGFRPLAEGRGFRPLAEGRGFRPLAVGRGFRPLAVGRGFRALAVGRGFRALAAGRGFRALAVGRGFNPGNKSNKIKRALAPAGCLPQPSTKQISRQEGLRNRIHPVQTSRMHKFVIAQSSTTRIVRNVSELIVEIFQVAYSVIMISTLPNFPGKLFPHSERKASLD